MKNVYFLAGIAWVLIVTVLLCLPGSTLPKNPFLLAIHADKWVHIFLFATGCYLFSRPFLNSGRSPGQKTAWFCAVATTGIAYGTGMEFVQEHWVSNRSFELADIAADSAGCLIALVICVMQLRSSRGKG
ncbi:VanZ family protein [Sediminibacterium soli]|uniref:VanZ family protein n=1 Tax=Sediminibacterium soli TaxID=2698829 RepID=UPI00137B3F35|nr:VanZ family protein [Sediminibacterium soli]NCI47747.1 hypothetical protein [Sediminibacterium soli]